MARLVLMLLGPPRLEREGVPVVMDTRKAMALLAYLAVSGEQPTREGLAALLYPESDSSHARAALRRTLFVLKAAIGEEWLLLDRDGVALRQGDEFWCDVAQFQQHLAQCKSHGHAEVEACPACLTHLAAAAALYRDDFLAGFTLPDSAAFDDWLFFQSEGLRRQFVTVLERLVEGHSALGEYEPAIIYARRWLALDSLHEPAHRHLMQLYAWSRQQAAALRQYQECVRLLDEELGVSPDEATTALYERIRKGEFRRLRDKPAESSASLVTPSLPHNLLSQLTSFIGREHEIAVVRQLLAEARLVTLTGAGGVGKTRLALAVAAGLLVAFGDGIWLVELAALSDPLLVPQTVVGVLKLPERPRHSPSELLLTYLQPKHLLLILDNCEHLIMACATLADQLLRACPRLVILATSREALNVGGEINWTVPSLTTPGLGAGVNLAPTAVDIDHYEAVRLFVDRARAAKPDFVLTEQNAPAIAQICVRLDGMPLALELAAARLKGLTVAQIAARLHDRFHLLTGGRRTALPRQQTLRASMDWSYDLLSEPERTLLRRLSVFAGGWTLEAAEYVTGGEGRIMHEAGGVRNGHFTFHPPPSTLELLLQLVSKSLVLTEERGTETRYRLLETIRQYAGEKLSEMGEAVALRARHVACFLALAEEAAAQLHGVDVAARLARLDVEHDNLRAALRWSLDRGDVETGVKLAWALGNFWSIRGYMNEGRAWLAEILALLEHSDAAPAVQVKAFVVAGHLATAQDDYRTARTLFEVALALRRELGDKEGIAKSLRRLGEVSFDQGDHARAQRLLEESVALARELGEKQEICSALLSLGWAAYFQGDYGRATAVLDDLVLVFRELGDTLSLARTLDGLACVAREQGDYTRATILFEEALELGRKIGHKWVTPSVLGHLGVVALYQGDHTQAKALLEEALALAQELQVTSWYIPYALGHLGLVAQYQDEPARATALCEQSLACWQELEHNWGSARARNQLGHVALAQGDYGRATMQLRASLVQSRDWLDRWGLPWCLEGLAEVCAGQGQPAPAAQLFGAAEVLRATLGAPLPPVERAGYARTAAAVRTQLAEDQFVAAWATGRAMTLEQAIAYALKTTAPPSSMTR